MNDNKKFWNRIAFIYEKVQTVGKGSRKFYDKLNTEIGKQLQSDMKVLELAMGPALLTEGIARQCNQLYATDFSEKMVLQARRKKLPDNVVIEQADATNLPYKDEEFDAIVIANALHIMPDPKKAICEIKRVLKKDGIIIAPTYTREITNNKLKLKVMSAVGFITYFPWNDKGYRDFLTEQGLKIVYHNIIMWSDFPESFVVCKKSDKGADDEKISYQKK